MKTFLNPAILNRTVLNRTVRNTAIVALAGIALAGSAAAQILGLNAAGATFPAPIYQKWFDEYKKAHANVQVNYQATGSGGGISALMQGTVDFAASDAPLTDKQITDLKVKPLHFPTVLGAVVLTYNLPGAPQDLKFSPETIAGIYLGKIVKWNDKAIAKDNPGVKLPTTDVLPVYRADGSGTTYIFTDYLSQVSPDWEKGPGKSTSVKFPVGTGQNKNDGVAGMVKQSPGAVGYVELIYALQNKMAVGLLKNSSGTFLKPTLESVTEAAAAKAKSMPADFRVSIVNAPGANAYPISSFTYLLIPSKINDAKKKAVIVDFLKWMLADGQKDCAALGYSELPKPVIAAELKQIGQIQ
jgi:phosphate transport system substrate-binding protein